MERDSTRRKASTKLRRPTGPIAEIRSVDRGGAFRPFIPRKAAGPARPGGPTRYLSQQIASTYKSCNPTGFQYISSFNPRRVLTKPSQGVSNNNYDNVNFDLILYVGTVLGLQRETKIRYEVIDMLGHGTFGQVVKCRHLETGKFVGVKIVKNKSAYYKQGLIEVDLLRMLNNTFDSDAMNLVKLLDYFVECDHLCLVFELLSSDLFSLLKQNHYRGLSTNLIRIFLKQLLAALDVLKECGIIHCDLKPENILLRTPRSPLLKLIDFGSACFEGQTVYTYIQSRFYRSPEVLLGLPYDSKIDMWSLGCICAELFLGLPVFPGQSEFNQLERIMEMLGDIPTALLREGKKTKKFFNPDAKSYRLKAQREFEVEQKIRLDPPKKYFAYSSIPELVRNYPFKGGLSAEAIAKEQNVRESFVDFLLGLLHLDPACRWSARQAKGHPFVQGTEFSGPYKPKPDDTVSKRRSIPGAGLTPASPYGHASAHYGPAPGYYAMSYSHGPPYTGPRSTRGSPTHRTVAYVRRGQHGSTTATEGSYRGRPRSVSHGGKPAGNTRSVRPEQSRYLAGTARAEFGSDRQRRSKPASRGGRYHNHASKAQQNVPSGQGSGRHRRTKSNEIDGSGSGDLSEVGSASSTAMDAPPHSSSAADKTASAGRTRANPRPGLRKTREKSNSHTQRSRGRGSVGKTGRSSSSRRHPGGDTSGGHPLSTAASSAKTTSKSNSRKHPRYRTPEECQKSS